MLSLRNPIALFVIFLCTLSANAQYSEYHHRQPEPIDSAKYYRKTISDLYKNTLDSLRQSNAFKTALEGLQRISRRSNGYTSFTLFGDAGKASYDVVNKGISAYGLPPLNGPQYRVGLGVSHEYQQLVAAQLWLRSYKVAKDQYLSLCRACCASDGSRVQTTR